MLQKYKEYCERRDWLIKNHPLPKIPDVVLGNKAEEEAKERNISYICRGCAILVKPDPITKKYHRFCDDCSKGGIRTIEGGRDYNRELVRMRDRHRCTKCGLKWKQDERRFDVHHIDGNCGKRSTVSSLKDESPRELMITLCHKCHLQLHSVREKMASASGRRFTDDDKKIILGMLEQNIPVREIIKEFGSNKTTIHRYKRMWLAYKKSVD